MWANSVISTRKRQALCWGCAWHLNCFHSDKALIKPVLKGFVWFGHYLSENMWDKWRESRRKDLYWLRSRKQIDWNIRTDWNRLVSLRKKRGSHMFSNTLQIHSKLLEREKNSLLPFTLNKTGSNGCRSEQELIESRHEELLRVRIINKKDCLEAQSMESQSLTFKNRLDICWEM